MDDLDFDISDFLGDISSGLDLSGGDTSWLDTVDWGSMMDTLDFSNLDLSNVYGDISAGGLGGPEDIVITGEAPIDLSGFDLESADQIYQGSNLGTDPYEIDGLQGSREDTYEEDLKDDFWKNLITEDEGAGTITITGTKPDDDDGEHTRIITPGPDDKCQPGSEKVYKYRDGSTMTLDCKGNVIGSTPATTDEPPDDPEPCEPGTETTKTYANGATITFDCKGRVISSTGPTTGPDVKTPPPPKKIDDISKLTALLGGLLGLLDRPKGGAAGYKGSIPKYMATRGPARSPTEGGRRPGAAGIGSLTGGVTYTPVGAAGGGLMGLAEGGKARPARYLRGGTDGMADKIQTDIDGKQPARLSHGEFVIPADVVSHLGNGNSDAGADVLYDMMAKVRKARTGNSKQGKQINPRKYTPA